MALWFECRARYEKIQENGSVKTVTEPYLVDALCFSEAESRFIENITPYISGEFTVTVAKKTKIAEIFFSESESADKEVYTVYSCAGRRFRRSACQLQRWNDRHNLRLRNRKHLGDSDNGYIHLPS